MDDTNWGIKISLPGYDVMNAPPEKCVVHSKFDTMKISSLANPAHFGVYTINFNTNSASRNLVSFTHGYSYRPAVVAHNKNLIAGQTYYSVNGRIMINAIDTYIRTYTTDTHLKIDFVRGATSPNMTGRTFTIRYYIFAEDGD